MTTEKKRGGRFSIDAHMVDRAPKAVIAVLRDLIVVECEMHFAGWRLEYVAYGPQFDEVQPGEMYPYYDVKIKDLKPGEYHVTFKRRE